MSVFEVCGWIGNGCFVICAFPQVLMVVRQGHARGLSLAFLGLWMTGLLFATVYILPLMLWPNLVNYAFGVVSVGIMLWYRLRPREEESHGNV